MGGARSGLLEYAVVVAQVLISVIVLAILVLVAYVVHKINPARFKLIAKLGRAASFTVEVVSRQEPPGRLPPKPPDELPPGKLPPELPSGASDARSSPGPR